MNSPPTCEAFAQKIFHPDAAICVMRILTCCFPNRTVTAAGHFLPSFGNMLTAPILPNRSSGGALRRIAAANATRIRNAEHE
jgi:hypothetical protein